MYVMAPEDSASWTRKARVGHSLWSFWQLEEADSHSAFCWPPLSFEELWEGSVLEGDSSLDSACLYICSSMLAISLSSLSLRSLSRSSSKLMLGTPSTPSQFYPARQLLCEGRTVRPCPSLFPTSSSQHSQVATEGSCLMAKTVELQLGQRAAKFQPDVGHFVCSQAEKLAEEIRFEIGLREQGDGHVAKVQVKHSRAAAFCFSQLGLDPA